MNKILFSVLFSAVYLLSSYVAVFAQCGPAGLDPCSIPKVLRPVVRTVVNKAQTIKKTTVDKTKSTRSSKAKTTKSAKAEKPDTSIYDSLMLKDPPKDEARFESEFFPLNGVVLGKTTEAQMRILNGQRNTYTDPKTGEQKIYYTIGKHDFWLNNGVADSVPVFKFDEMPLKWMILGFDFKISYNKSIARLKSLGYTVETSVALPKLEEISSGKSTTARIKATKNGELPLVVGMNFIFDNGKNFDSPESLFYMVVNAKH
ncbi:MAG: hypothetical protein ABIP06_11780 [Pyrinomonadaceae bacterium]